MKVFQNIREKMSCYDQQKYYTLRCNNIAIIPYFMKQMKEFGNTTNYFYKSINYLSVKYSRNIIINSQWKSDLIKVIRFCYYFVTRSISNRLKSLISLNLSFSSIYICRNKESVNSWPYDIFICVGLCNCVFVHVCICVFGWVLVYLCS